MRAKPAAPQKNFICTDCNTIVRIDGTKNYGGRFNWLKHCWEALCLGCYEKTLPPKVVKPKLSRGKQKFAKLMRGALRATRSQSKRPCQSGK